MPLPEFEPGKIYLVRGHTILAYFDELNTNRPAGGNGILVSGISADGSAAETVVADDGTPLPGGGSAPYERPPKIDPEKVYFLTEKLLARMEAAARRNHARAVDGGGLITTESAGGVNYDLTTAAPPSD